MFHYTLSWRNSSWCICAASICSRRKATTMYFCISYQTEHWTCFNPANVWKMYQTVAIEWDPRDRQTWKLTKKYNYQKQISFPFSWQQNAHLCKWFFSTSVILYWVTQIYQDRTAVTRILSKRSCLNCCWITKGQHMLQNIGSLKTALLSSARYSLFLSLFFWSSQFRASSID